MMILVRSKQGRLERQAQKKKKKKKACGGWGLALAEGMAVAMVQRASERAKGSEEGHTTKVRDKSGEREVTGVDGQVLGSWALGSWEWSWSGVA